MTLTFHQWPWIKVMTLLWVYCNNSIKYSSSWTRWKILARTMSKTTMCIVTLTSDLGWRSWHFRGSNVTILWNIPIYEFSENLWPGQCLNHYEHSDLDLWPTTLSQVHTTSLGPGQQSCERLFKSIKRVRSYGPDNFLNIMCIVTLTLTYYLVLRSCHFIRSRATIMKY
jgi:hypothetical protein